MPYPRATFAAIAPLLLGLACVTWSGCNDCDFLGTRCAGNVVEQCGGVDQQIGRTVERTTCQGLNPVCVQANETRALCATSASARCTGSSSRCEGNTVVECKDGFEVATDCSQVKEAGPGAMAGLYRCSALPGGPADCHKPVN